MKAYTSRRTALVGACALVVTPIWALPAQATPENDNIVINELYLRGGSKNQPYTHKFVELYNPTDAEISLDGMSLQYFSSSNADASNNVSLEGYSIEAGGYFLVRGGTNGSNGEAVPNVDLVAGGLNPGGANGAIALVDGSADVDGVAAGDVSGNENFIDFVGYGTSVKFETKAASYDGGNSDPGSITRTNGLDTDDNSADFDFVTVPTPQGSDDTAPDPDPDPDPELVAIEDIQGTGDTTPLDGDEVITRGVVTGVYTSGGFNGVYLQTPGTGGKIGDASHGIFVYSGSMANDVEYGEYVEVTGTADEYFTLTQLSNPTWEVLDETVEAPIPAVVTPADLATDEQREALEGMLIDVSAIEFTVTDSYQTNAHGQVALAMDSAALPTETDIYNPVTEQAEHDALVAENYSKMLTLDDGSSYNYTDFRFDDHEIPVPYLNLDTPLRVGAGAEITDPVILDYRYQWNLQPTERITGENDDFAVFEDTRAAEAEAPEVGGDITISTFNVLNYFTTLGVDLPGCTAYTDREGNPISVRGGCLVRGAWDAENLARQEGKIVTAIEELDASVVGLEEIENSAPFGKDRDDALANLVDALNANAGFDKWAYAESPADLPEDEDVIRLAFIYQVDEVTPTEESKILIGNDAFHNAREPLGQAWQALDDAGEPVGEEFVTITNHFKSKGSGTDDGTGQGNANPDRINQANALLDFAEAEYADHPVFLVGDFNSYGAEDPLRALEADGYVNLLAEKSEQIGEHLYTYTFDKRAGSLDHIFASETAHDWVVDTDVWNINSVESVGMEYSRHNYNVTNLFEADIAFRSSDHDPIKVGLDVPGLNDIVVVETEAPAFADNVITIPTVEGVEYLIDGEVVTGDVEITEDTTVTARALDGYELSEESVTSWTFEYVAPVLPDPKGNVFYVSDDWNGGDFVDAFAYGRIGDEVYAGDWDGDGYDTLAVRRGKTFYVNNELKGGNADAEFKYGRLGDEVLVGDWNNDGTDTFGVRRGHTFYLNNELIGGNAEVEFKYGRDGDDVLVGDWDGTDGDTITIRRGSVYYVNNEHLGGNAKIVYNYGWASDQALAGDFDGDGIDTVSIRRANVFHINNALTGGDADHEVKIGRASDAVLIGDWNGDGVDTPILNRVVR